MINVYELSKKQVDKCKRCAMLTHIGKLVIIQPNRTFQPGDIGECFIENECLTKSNE